jgi:hypothetical protein
LQNSCFHWISYTGNQLKEVLKRLKIAVVVLWFRWWDAGFLLWGPGLKPRAFVWALWWADGTGEIFWLFSAHFQTSDTSGSSVFISDVCNRVSQSAHNQNFTSDLAFVWTLNEDILYCKLPSWNYWPKIKDNWNRSSLSK